MTVSMIVAVASNGVIGMDNMLPWRLPRDLQEFKRVTMGHHLIMGRKTFEGVGALPGRTTLVLSRRPISLPDGVSHASSIEEALSMAEAAGDDEAFIAGGGEVYHQAIGLTDRLYLTRVHVELAGDTLFPEIEQSWREVSRLDVEMDERHAFPFTFHVYDRDCPGVVSDTASGVPGS